MSNITITRKFKGIKDKIFKLLLTRDDFIYKIERLKQANLSVKPTIKSELVEMFKVFGIPCERGREDSYYEKLVKNTELPSFHDVEKRIINIMYKLFKVYPTPEDYMKRIVDRLQDPDDGWQNDTLRLRILKQFIKYGNFMSYKGQDERKIKIYGGETYIKSYVKNKTGRNLEKTEDITANIDDDIFNVLKTATKAQRQPRGKYALISMSDDLAKGRFKTDGATKRDLYFFAMVFGMTYYCGNGDSDTIIDYDSDIEKNLFEDYYTNNLMRFITEAYENKWNSFELDPSGIGINYKNYAELILIYFISKDYTPEEKIKKSHEMIERLKSSETPSGIPVESQTEHYINIFTDDVLSMSEDDFEKFISQNYDCNVCARPALQVNISQKTAFDVYNELVEGLKYISSETDECDCDLWFNNDRSLRYIPDNKNKQDFIKLLDAMNRFLDMKKKITSEKITRTAVITAYYYYYNAMNRSKSIKKSFVDVWSDYTNSIKGLNALLTEAHYQPISERNIFDIAVIFSSYALLAYSKF